MSWILSDLDIKPKHNLMQQAFSYPVVKDAQILHERLEDVRKKDAKGTGEGTDDNTGLGTTTLRTAWEMLTTTENHQGLHFVARMTRKFVLPQSRSVPCCWGQWLYSLGIGSHFVSWHRESTSCAKLMLSLLIYIQSPRHSSVINVDTRGYPKHGAPDTSLKIQYTYVATRRIIQCEFDVSERPLSM